MCALFSTKVKNDLFQSVNQCVGTLDQLCNQTFELKLLIAVLKNASIKIDWLPLIKVTLEKKNIFLITLSGGLSCTVEVH